jgi:hypothetical protein
MREARESVPTPLISVVIPAYNEEGVLRHSIPKIIECLLMIDEVKDSQGTYEVLIVNDGSADKTESEALNLAREFREIRLLFLRKGSCTILTIGAMMTLLFIILFALLLVNECYKSTATSETRINPIVIALTELTTKSSSTTSESEPFPQKVNPTETVNAIVKSTTQSPSI